MYHRTSQTIIESLNGGNGSRRSPEEKMRKDRDKKLHPYLQQRNSQRKCRHHVLVPASDVGIAVVILLPNQRLDGLLEREDFDVPRQGKLGLETEVLASRMLELDELRMRRAIAPETKRRRSLERRMLVGTILSVCRHICLNPSKCKWILYEKSDETYGISTMPAREAVGLAVGFDQTIESRAEVSNRPCNGVDNLDVVY